MKPSACVAGVVMIILIAGCSTLPPVPGPGSKTVEIAFAGVAKDANADKGIPTSTIKGGLFDLLTASRAAAFETGREPSVRLSREVLEKEINHTLEAVRFGKPAAAVMGFDGGAARYEQFVVAYFDGYFRKFHFVNAGLNKDDAKARLKQDLLNSFHLDRPLTKKEDEMLDEMVDKMIAAACTNPTCSFVTADEKSGFFYNRAGAKYGFPTINFSITPGAGKGYEVTKIDEIALIGDVVRVTVEALADATNPNICADAKSTGCTSGLFPKASCIAETDTANYKLLKQIVKSADTAEVVVGYAAAQAVRGGYWVALNNEAIAKAVQTALSVTARKVAEEVEGRTVGCPAKPGEKPERVIRTLTVRVVE